MLKFIIPAVLMFLLGSIWFMQGIGIMLNSAMSNQPFWAIAGGALALGGIVVGAVGFNRRNTK